MDNASSTKNIKNTKIQTIQTNDPFQRKEWIYQFSPQFVYPPRVQALSTKKGTSMVSEGPLAKL